MTVRPRRSLRFAAAAFVLAGAAVLSTATASAAGAAAGCGEYSFGFEGTRLLNDGISDSAGPFAITMPAGTYEITLHSFDDHADHPGQTEQTQEQWYFTLDSGYVSPVSSDIPDESNTAVDSFTGVIKADASAITVHHLGEGGINSVAPMCVGFTTVSTPAEPSQVPGGDEPVLPATDIPNLPEVPVVSEVPNDPEVPVEVKRAVEVMDSSSVSEVADPSVVVAAPAPLLAITGPSTKTWALVLAGAGLFVLGCALLLAERRSSISY